MDSFAQPVFVSSPAWELQQQLDSAPERSRYPAAGSSLSAKQIRRSVPAQPVRRPLAFLQASLVQERTSFHAAWIFVAVVLGILD
jgi:hypothetical protein